MAVKNWTNDLFIVENKKIPMAKQCAKKETWLAWQYHRKLVLPYDEYQAYVKMSTSDIHTG
jgi:hypothetical protein